MKQYKTISACFIFFILYGLVYLWRPAFLFKVDVVPREFGVGYREKTILPLWLFSILLGLFCYFLVLYFIVSPHIFL